MNKKLFSQEMKSPAAEIVSEILRFKRDYLDIDNFQLSIKGPSPISYKDNKLSIEYVLMTRTEAQNTIKELTQTNQKYKTVFKWYHKTYPPLSHPVLDKVDFVCNLYNSHHDKLHPLIKRQ